MNKQRKRAKRPWEDRAFAFLNSASKKVYMRRDLSQLLEAHRAEWQVSKSTTITRFIEALQRHGDLKMVVVAPDTVPDSDAAYQQEVGRYTWGSASPYSIG